MDPEEKKKRQFIKVLLAEIAMVAAVVLIVVVATLLTMGFSITQNGKIEQTGLMQLHSIPTGATVEIDGSTIFPRTNLSRTLSAGEHEIKISRAGYDTWSKRVEIHSGVLTRIYYPRLFLKEREPEIVSKFEADEIEFLKASPSRNYIIYAVKDAAEWQLLDVRGDDIKTSVLDLTNVLPGVVEDKIMTGVTRPSMVTTSARHRFEGEILDLRWSENDDRILVKVRHQDRTEWILVNLQNVAKSLNLTRTFGMNFEQVEMIDGSASQLYVLENRQLRKINTVGEAVSRILLKNVERFANLGANVIYVSQLGLSALTERETEGREVGVYRDDEKSSTVLAQVKDRDAEVQIALAKYYGEDYMVYTLNNKLTILYGSIPSYSDNGADLTELKNLVEGKELVKAPDSLAVSKEGQYVVARKGQQWVVVDLDMGDLYEYAVPTAALNWLDESMMYATVDERVTVWDYDGTNMRTLVGEAVEKEEALQNGEMNLKDGGSNVVEPYAALITTNNRWLYYVTRGEEGLQLTREKIRD